MLSKNSNMSHGEQPDGNRKWLYIIITRSFSVRWCCFSFSCAIRWFAKPRSESKLLFAYEHMRDNDALPFATIPARVARQP